MLVVDVFGRVLVAELAFELVATDAEVSVALGWLALVGAEVLAEDVPQPALLFSRS